MTARNAAVVYRWQVQGVVVNKQSDAGRVYAAGIDGIDGSWTGWLAEIVRELDAGTPVRVTLEVL